MADFALITRRAADNQNNRLSKVSVPFRPEINARQALEPAFILGQTPQSASLFAFAPQTYCGSGSQQFPGYPGYEIESIGGFAVNDQFDWQVTVDGVSSLFHGAIFSIPGCFRFFATA